MKTATIDEIRPALWADLDTVHPPGARVEEKYQAVIFEQYKIYLEMADRISARRSHTNTFFLTLNTLVITVAGTQWKDGSAATALVLAVPLTALMLQCGAWFWILRSYRQLNSAKYIVVGALEERLPASPYWRAEWRALGEGTNPAYYWPLTHLEQWIPALFAVTYMAAFIAAIAV